MTLFVFESFESQEEKDIQIRLILRGFNKGAVYSCMGGVWGNHESTGNGVSDSRAASALTAKLTRGVGGFGNWKGMESFKNLEKLWF